MLGCLERLLASLYLSACLSSWTKSAQIGRIFREILDWGLLLKSVSHVQFRLKSEKMTFTVLHGVGCELRPKKKLTI